MQKILLLTCTFFLFCITVCAQTVNTDSLSLETRITADQLKLGKLQNQLEKQIRNSQTASERAQRSANKNSVAASKLRANPENRKLARKAKNKAKEARKDSRNARKESDKLEELHKNIGELKNKIADNEAKLNKHLPTEK